MPEAETMDEVRRRAAPSFIDAILKHHDIDAVLKHHDMDAILFLFMFVSLFCVTSFYVNIQLLHTNHAISSFYFIY